MLLEAMNTTCGRPLFFADAAKATLKKSLRIRSALIWNALQTKARARYGEDSQRRRALKVEVLTAASRLCSACLTGRRLLKPFPICPVEPYPQSAGGPGVPLAKVQHQPGLPRPFKWQARQYERRTCRGAY